MIGNIDLTYSMVDVFDDCEQLIDRADVVNGYRFITLEDTKFWKSSLNREKNLEDIKKIDEYLNKRN